MCLSLGLCTLVKICIKKVPRCVMGTLCVYDYVVDLWWIGLFYGGSGWFYGGSGWLVELGVGQMW